jgi:hypothetical protein
MRIFKYKRFHQWARHEGIQDCTLKKAVRELINGLSDANNAGIEKLISIGELIEVNDYVK